MDLINWLSKGAKAYILLAVLTLVAALPGVLNLPVLDRDEARFAQASRQMAETGDLITIRFQNELRNKKPAGIHWLQAASVSALSDTDSSEIWPYRLPSLVGAIVAVCLCFWFGAGLIGRPAAFLGTSLFATSMLLTTEAHIAKTDAVLVATACLIFGAFSKLYLGTRHETRWTIVAWIGAAASMLIKGPVIIGLAAALLAGLYAFERRAGWMRPLLKPQGWLLFLALTLPWFILVQIETGGAYLDGALGKDFADKVSGASEGHAGPPGYHTLLLLVLFFPGTLFLVPAVRSMASVLRSRDRGQPSPALFLTAWVLTTWVIFEALPTKLPHYVLPAYPALSLLCGLGMKASLETGWSPANRFWSAVAFAIGGATLLYVSHVMGFYSLLSVDLPTMIDFQSSHLIIDEPIALLQVYWYPSAVLVGAVVLLALVGSMRTALVGAITASLMLGFHIRGNFLPERSELFASRIAYSLIADDLGANGDGLVPVIGYSEPSLVFLSANRVDFVKTVERAVPGDIYLVNLLSETGAAAIEALAAKKENAALCYTQSAALFAFNYSKGDPAAFVQINIEACS